MESIKYKSYQININYDECIESPREWDNLGKIIAWHKRYNLSDKNIEEQYIYSKDCKLKDLVNYCNNWEEVEEVIKKELNIKFIYPLFLYDHSYLSLKTYRHGQHSAWDCGQVGFIYITKEDYKKIETKKSSKRQYCDKIIESELEIYTQYLNGECYCFNIKDEEETIDSCGGFYSVNDAIEYAKEEIDNLIERHKEDLHNTANFISCC